MVWVAGGVGLGDEPTEGAAIDDGLLDAERIAEPLHVVAPLGEGPSLRTASSAATVATLIEVDDLDDAGQGGERRLVHRVVETRPAMQEDERRLRSHARTVRYQARPFHVEIELGAVDLDEHGMPCGLAVAIAADSLPVRVVFGHQNTWRLLPLEGRLERHGLSSPTPSAHCTPTSELSPMAFLVGGEACQRHPSLTRQV
jgi:hypothetical protein